MPRPPEIRRTGPLTLEERITHAKTRLHEAKLLRWKHEQDPTYDAAIHARARELRALELLRDARLASKKAQSDARQNRKPLVIDG